MNRAELAYDQLAVRSELLAARRDQLIEQRAQINLMIGSPAAVFMWANRLERAEGSLNRARTALWDWLVALEYYAVRPFVDLRIQLLLAQNPYQFEDIASQLRRLQGECGGEQNYASVTVSLADAMGYDVDQLDPVSGEVVPASVAFRSALGRGDVAVGRRVRLGSMLFGADLWSLPSLWAGTIDIDIERFPNLATSCNARLYSVDLAVVGDVGEEVRPTVQMVHSGASELRSCQPDLRDYLDSVGPDATSFDLVTRFEAQPRVVGPLSDVGEFASPPDLESGNETLRGLPFAAEYVVLIDRALGDNQDVRWSELEDVLVRFNFTYQDPFPRSECR